MSDFEQPGKMVESPSSVSFRPMLIDHGIRQVQHRGYESGTSRRWQPHRTMILDRADLERRGFQGFESVSVLLKTAVRIPAECGVYVALRVKPDLPRFLEVNPAGRFKKKDPTRPVQVLEAKWSKASGLVYIGKAGPSPTRTLRKRISEYLRFGTGARVAHQGGSATWQLTDSHDLLIAWMPTGNRNPRDVERGLLREFRECYGRLPFANWKQ